MSSIVCCILLLAGSAAAVWALTPPAARMGLRLGLVDLPSTRRVRARAIPTTGGIVIFAVATASMALAAKFCATTAPSMSAKISAMTLGATGVVILGVFDDRLNLKPYVKLAVQVALAAGMASSGVGIERIRFFTGEAVSLGWMSYPLTVLWFVAFMNALNLIDGLDGLAGGIAAIGAGGLLAVSIINTYPSLALLCAGLLGSTVGFLLHNFRRGNVYLGDAGSMALGFLLAGVAIIGSDHDAASDSMLVAAACMAVPAFDVATTILRRVRTGRGVMTPDRSHVHHRLIRFGLSTRSAVILIWGVTMFFGGQMLGLITPHGLIYIIGSYVAAAAVMNSILRQRQKNAKTTRRLLRDEFLYLVGASQSIDGEAVGEEGDLRDIIAEQVRRETLYRRMEKAAALRAGPAPAAPGPADASSESGASEAEADREKVKETIGTA